MVRRIGRARQPVTALGAERASLYHAYPDRAPEEKAGMQSKSWRFWLLLLGWSGLLWACGWLQRAPTTPPPLPTPTNLPSAQEALRQAATQIAVTGQVTLRLHEGQLTAALQRALAQQADTPIHNPQVYLREGKVSVYATVDSPIGPLAAELVLTPTITAEGGLTIAVDKATLGGMAMPQDMLDEYIGQIQQVLEGWTGRYVVDELHIADGWLVVQAHRR